MDDAHLTDTVGPIIQRFEATHAVRDRAVTEGRQLVRLSANAIRALHRGDNTEADALIEQALGRLGELTEVLRDHPAVYWAGYVQDAMKEVAEAAITRAVLSDEPLPKPEVLRIEDAAYLNGLAEAASELRRDVLDQLRGERLDLAERYLAAMDEIYAALVMVDYPDTVTGGLRRTTDQLRAVLERTRGDVTLTLNQRRLERAVLSVEEQFQQATPKAGTPPEK